MSILKLNKVSLTYFSDNGETKAIEDVSFEVKEGEFIAILGPSGSGKTTVLSLISGLIKPTKGSVIINGKTGDGLKDETGYMFQKDHLFEWRTIIKNIMIGLEIQEKSLEKRIKKEYYKNNKISFFSISKKIKAITEIKKNIKNIKENHKEYALNLLKKYDLYDFKNNYPSQLSGGMRQRAALIRTLVLNPSILLLDEPFSALDYQTRIKLCDDVSNIIRNENKTTVLVTHDLTEAISMADKIIILTKRPAKIKNIVDIDFDSSLTPFQRRENKNFLYYYDKIWKEIQEDEEGKDTVKN